MKIAIDLKSLDWTEYKTQEDYDADDNSPAGEQRKKARPWSERTRGGPIERYTCDPQKFPCIGIRNGGICRNPNGADENEILFLYDYEVLST